MNDSSPPRRGLGCANCVPRPTVRLAPEPTRPLAKPTAKAKQVVTPPPTPRQHWPVVRADPGPTPAKLDKLGDKLTPKGVGRGGSQRPAAGAYLCARFACGGSDPAVRPVGRRLAGRAPADRGPGCRRSAHNNGVVGRTPCVQRAMAQMVPAPMTVHLIEGPRLCAIAPNATRTDRLRQSSNPTPGTSSSGALHARHAPTTHSLRSRSSAPCVTSWPAAAIISAISAWVSSRRRDLAAIRRN